VPFTMTGPRKRIHSLWGFRDDGAGGDGATGEAGTDRAGTIVGLAGLGDPGALGRDDWLPGVLGHLSASVFRPRTAEAGLDVDHGVGRATGDGWSWSRVANAAGAR